MSLCRVRGACLNACFATPRCPVAHGSDDAPLASAPDELRVQCPTGRDIASHRPSVSLSLNCSLASRCSPPCARGQPSRYRCVLQKVSEGMHWTHGACDASGHRGAERCCCCRLLSASDALALATIGFKGARIHSFATYEDAAAFIKKQRDIDRESRFTVDRPAAAAPMADPPCSQSRQ